MPFVLYRELRNHHDSSINCLAFSFDGEHLASGGDDKLVLIHAFREMKAYPLKIRYPASINVLQWLPSGELFVGLTDGTLHLLFIDFVKGRLKNVFVRRMPSGEISSMAFNSKRRWLAVGSGRQVHVFDMTNMKAGRCHEKIVVKPFRAKSMESLDSEDSYEVCGIHFMDRGDTLLIAYLGGDVCRFNLMTGEDQHLACVDRHSFIGTSALDVTETYLSLFNLRDGFDLYDIRNGKLFAKIKTRIRENVIIPSLFTSNGQSIVVGASDGNVMIIDLLDMDVTDTLDHGGDIVQAVACSKSTKPGVVSYIATGPAEKGTQTYIKVWASVGDHDDRNHSKLLLSCSCHECRKFENLGIAALACVVVALIVFRYNISSLIVWSCIAFWFQKYISHPTSQVLAAFGAAVHRYFSSPAVRHNLDNL